VNTASVLKDSVARWKVEIVNTAYGNKDSVARCKTDIVNTASGLKDSVARCEYFFHISSTFVKKFMEMDTKYSNY